MLELDQVTLRKLHMNQMEMLVEVDRICRKNNIKYNIIAGTMLGAVRHGGYIPWDDDADIGMVREEYERFRKVCKKELDKTRFYFQDDRNTRDYRWGYGKIRLKNTLFLRENQSHMKFGQEVFIDIFPLDNVPDNAVLKRIHCFKCFIVRKFLWSAVGRVADKSKLKRIVYSIMYKVPKRVVYRCYYRMIGRVNAKQTKMVRVSLFPAPKAYGLLREWFEDRKEIAFEGKMFYGPRNYDAYLTAKYGDYKKLPPEDHRKVHPVTKIKLLDIFED